MAAALCQCYRVSTFVLDSYAAGLFFRVEFLFFLSKGVALEKRCASSVKPTLKSKSVLFSVYCIITLRLNVPLRKINLNISVFQ